MEVSPPARFGRFSKAGGQEALDGFALKEGTWNPTVQQRSDRSRLNPQFLVS